MKLYNNWQVDLKDSIRALEKIKDTYLPKVISGTIYTIEAQNNNILMLLDEKSGIDYIRENDIGLQGIAARVQWGYAWNTFTIRSERYTQTKTELQKRKEAIKKGYFYPAFTLQAYFDNRKDNNLLSLGIIKTLDLYRFIEQYPEKINQNKSDNNFIFIKWIDLLPLMRKVELRPLKRKS